MEPNNGLRQGKPWNGVLMPLRRELYPGGPGYASIITWELISALIRYVRAHNCCEWCNVTNGQVVQGSKMQDYRVILTVAHLDHDKSNSLDPANLAALCQRCHLTYDAPMKHARRRHGEDQQELIPFDVADAVAATKEKLGLPSDRRTKSLAGNSFWSGGRTIDPRGYELVKQPLHHRADVRGYVYGHVLMAEKALGRTLRPGEQIRRHDSSRPFSLNNFKVTGRAKIERRECACGCGEGFDSHDSSGRERVYVSGHNTAHEGARPLGKGRRYGLDKDDRDELFAEFDGLCAYGCGRSATSIDHVKPRSCGGTNNPHNLVPACGPCNSAKNARDWYQWVRRGCTRTSGFGWMTRIENETSWGDPEPLEWAGDEFWDRWDDDDGRTWDEMPMTASVEAS